MSSQSTSSTSCSDPHNSSPSTSCSSPSSPIPSSHPLSLKSLLNPGSSTSTPSSPSPPHDPPSPADFPSRVASIPVVNSITQFYEHSKSSSPLLRIGAQTVETSVKAVYRPIQGLVEPQLSSFGCRQLDLIQQNYPFVMEKPETMYASGKKFIQDTINKQLDHALSAAESAVDHFFPEVAPPQNSEQKPDQKDSHGHTPNGTILNELPRNGVSHKSSSSPSSSSLNGHATNTHLTNGHAPSCHASNEHAANGVVHEKIASEVSLGRVQKIGSRVQNRIHKNAVSRWNAVYVKSEESINGLENAVSIIKNAQFHISMQTERLKNTLSQMQLYIESKSLDLTRSIQQQANEALRITAQAIQALQKDILDTLKRAIEIISRTATTMPSYAQTKIKEFLFSLPNRWAAINGASNALPHDDQSFLLHGHQVVRFAEESSSTLRSILEIFGQYIEKAKSLLQNFKVSMSPPASPNESMNSPQPFQSPPSSPSMRVDSPEREECGK